MKQHNLNNSLKLNITPRKDYIFAVLFCLVLFISVYKFDFSNFSIAQWLYCMGLSCVYIVSCIQYLILNREKLRIYQLFQSSTKIPLKHIQCIYLIYYPKNSDTVWQPALFSAHPSTADQKIWLKDCQIHFRLDVKIENNTKNITHPLFGVHPQKTEKLLAYLEEFTQLKITQLPIEDIAQYPELVEDRQTSKQSLFSSKLTIGILIALVVLTLIISYLVIFVWRI